MNANFAFLNSFANINETTFDTLKNISSYRTLNKHEIIAKEGEMPCTNVYMLNSGIMRAYINEESGKQHNKKIFAPTSFVGALTAIITNKPSKFTYQALTNCEVFEIDFASFLTLCQTDISLTNLYNRVLENVFMEYERRSLELMTLNATQRYLNLRQRIPDIDELIPQFQIASFLNITPVQLSRIRKKLNYKHMLIRN